MMKALTEMHSAKSVKNVLLRLTLSIIVVFSITLSACNKRTGNARILVFTKTAGYRHASIGSGISAIQKLGIENDFDVDTTSNPNYFTEDSLKNYSAVVFLSTTGDLLNNYQEADFERYIQAGGGYMGIHAATDAEYDWGWYGRLAGGYFDNHPEQQEAVLNVVDADHEATKHLPKQWKRKDEWYNFKKLNKDVKVLLTIDEKSYKGGKNGANHPMAWYHDFDGGRAFYTELGHTEESYSDPLYLKHILGGIKYAIGDNKELDYDDSKSLRVPEEDRFVKTNLNQGGFFEPTEMAILPDLNILVSQRRGELMMYEKKTGTVKQVGFLNVYWKTTIEGVNAEEGFLGITADPNFKKNNYVYLFYSPADTSVNRLSRFVFKNDKLDMKSEKVILQYYSQRNICCHTGGSVAFGEDNILYVSTGDNTTPFDEKGQKYLSHGYAPLDDRPGHLNYDEGRSSGNTNDLRGKILRIKINEDGTYSIPEGNLFPEKNPKTRPEIYVMGDRNPYRISIDKKTGYLYWGEVGPDANADSMETRGPRGYDEINQARKAGNFGWPYFIANNIPYRQYDYATGKSGAPFNPAKPVNNSRNNTGLKELPPATPAFIYYPYAASAEFPQVGTGGRTSMAGPVYYTEDYKPYSRYPDYYNGKLFIYDWIRNWIKVVTMTPNGDFDKMEPFMEHTKFKNFIDMEVGPDGLIYVLEYGSGWFSKNDDSGIARLDYISGNLPPKVGELTIERTSGPLPFNLKARVKATDPEKGKLKYVWTIGGTGLETDSPMLNYTIKEAGDHEISVKVIDEKKDFSVSNTIPVFAGNAAPKVTVSLNGNKTFYFPGKPVNYRVLVNDHGDQVDIKNLFVASDYIEGTDLAAASMGHKSVSETIEGKNIMMALDCKSCHKVDQPSIGPAYVSVSKKYQGKPDAMAHLTQKILKGGSGVWGENAMPGHPNLKEADAKQIVRWVLSLASGSSSKPSLSPSGQILVKGDPKKQNAAFTLTASYTDNGKAGVRPLTGTNAVYLRNSRMDVSNVDVVSGFAGIDSAGSKFLVFPGGQGVLKVSRLDLSGIKNITLIGFGREKAAVYTVELRTDRPNGALIGSGAIIFAGNKQGVSGSVALKAPADSRLHDLYLIVKSKGTNLNPAPLLKTISFIPQ